MKTSRFSDSQIIAVLKQAEGGKPVPELRRPQSAVAHPQTTQLETSPRRAGPALHLCHPRRPPILDTLAPPLHLLPPVVSLPPVFQVVDFPSSALSLALFAAVSVQQPVIRVTQPVPNPTTVADPDPLSLAKPFPHKSAKSDTASPRSARCC